MNFQIKSNMLSKVRLEEVSFYRLSNLSKSIEKLLKVFLILSFFNNMIFYITYGNK